MPVIVEPADFAQWLADDTPREALEQLLTTYSAERMQLNPVSTTVNSPRTEGPQCVVTVRPEKTQGSLFD